MTDHSTLRKRSLLVYPRSLSIQSPARQLLLVWRIPSALVAPHFEYIDTHGGVFEARYAEDARIVASLLPNSIDVSFVSSKCTSPSCLVDNHDARTMPPHRLLTNSADFPSDQLTPAEALPATGLPGYYCHRPECGSLVYPSVSEGTNLDVLWQHQAARRAAHAHWLGHIEADWLESEGGCPTYTEAKLGYWQGLSSIEMRWVSPLAAPRALY